MAGNQGNNKIIWEQWQIDYLLKNWERMTAQELSEKLGIKRTKVREKKYELGLYKLKLEYWTDEQIQYLKRNYKSKGDTELAEIFNKKWHKEKGWKNKHIEKKRRYLNLKRTEEQKKIIKERNRKKGVWKEGNRKMWEKRDKAKEREIRFWKENNGREVPRIKINGKFIHYARWRYEQLYGKVENGMNVIFKDGNPRNISDENLIKVSDAELAIINSKNSGSIGLGDNYIVGILSFKQPELRDIIKQYPKLIELKRQSIILKRTIKNERENNQQTRTTNQ